MLILLSSVDVTQDDLSSASGIVLEVAKSDADEARIGI